MIQIDESKPSIFGIPAIQHVPGKIISANSVSPEAIETRQEVNAVFAYEQIRFNLSVILKNATKISNTNTKEENDFYNQSIRAAWKAIEAHLADAKLSTPEKLYEELERGIRQNDALKNILQRADKDNERL